MSYKTASTFLQSKSVLLRVLARTVFVLREKIAAAIERRRVGTALNKLDDYMLKDMGIARADVERIARSCPPV